MISPVLQGDVLDRIPYTAANFEGRLQAVNPYAMLLSFGEKPIEINKNSSPKEIRLASGFTICNSAWKLAGVYGILDDKSPRSTGEILFRKLVLYVKGLQACSLVLFHHKKEVIEKRDHQDSSY